MRVQFELEKYNAMEPKPQVFARDGRIVRILVTDVDNSTMPIAFTVSSGVVFQARVDGTTMYDRSEETIDLFMEVPEPEWEPSEQEKRQWLNSLYISAVANCHYMSSSWGQAEHALKREHALEQRIAELERKLAEKEQG